MERKLIANHLVPDNEVWVSPTTWERPFSLKAKESTVTDTQKLKVEITALANEIEGNPISGYYGLSIAEILKRMRQLLAVKQNVV